MPNHAYEYAEWKRCRAKLDYHIEIANYHYSVPYNLVHQEVEARITQKTSDLPPRQTDCVASAQHTAASPWIHEPIRSKAAKVGPEAEALIDVVLRSRPHPEQGFRSAVGILGLVKRYGQERVDAACARALLLNVRLYKLIAAILKNGTDRTLLAPRKGAHPLPRKLGGHSYYN